MRQEREESTNKTPYSPLNKKPNINKQAKSPKRELLSKKQASRGDSETTMIAYKMVTKELV
jgi:hypothetical protein